MPDNILPANGAVVALERVGTVAGPAAADVLYLGKFGWGPFGTYNPITKDGAGGMPVQLDNSTGAIFGAPNEVAAANEGSTAGIIPLLKAILRDFRARIPVLGQATMAQSIPVTIASNQSALSLTGTVGLLVGGSSAAGGSGAVSTSTLRITQASEDQALIGATNSAAAADETTITGLNGVLKGIFARLRGTLTVAPTILGTTTREYSLANGLRTAFTSTSTAAAGLPALGTSREVRLAASARCWVVWGSSGVAAAAPESTSFVVEANTPEVIRIPSGATHFRVVRDSADGFLLMTPVA